MRRRDRRVIAAVVAVAVAAVVAVVVLATTRGSNPKPKGVQADRTTTIKVDGVSLAAEIVTPKGAGRHPLLVMPASWNGPATMYRTLAARFARAGYQVVAYAQRGFRGSTGQIDFAGANTQRDASAVLSWALTHTRADPQRIGMLGMSYGAGIALLTAAHDKRVRAVVATSSWADMAGALDFNDTPSTAALQLLLGGSRSYDATVRRLRDALAGAPQSLASILRSMSPARSADSYLAELNRNKPAIMLANAFEDSILSPGQLVPFFERLTGPKRLELAEGDHGGPEFPSLLGGSSATIDDAVAWLDHYVRGVANGIDKRQPILLRAIGTSQARGFSAWPKAADRVALGRPGSTDRSAAWTATLQAGADSAATNGPAQFARGANYQPQQLVLAALDRHRALVWTGDRLATSTSLNGTPSVHLTLASAARAATVFAYLYDVAPDGAGTLLDMAPYSATGLTTSRAVTFDMQPTSYTVPAGHRIALVVDAADPRYPSLAPRGTTLTVSSSSADPAALTLPTSA